MFKINGQKIELREFPDGTPALQIAEVGTCATLEWIYEKNEEILLYYITSHLRAYHRVKELHLVMPYIAHARLDRVDDVETVFTLKYFCNFINGLKFDTVTVRDAHSNVSVGMLDNVVTEAVTPIIKGLIDRLFTHTEQVNPSILFFPDEGASKRYAKKLDYASCFGIKTRVDGKVETLELKGQLPEGKFDVLIVDDISSYGNTFLKAAKALREQGADTIYLYVTHAENSILKGELTTCGLFKKIYTTESIYSGDHELVEVLGN